MTDKTEAQPEALRLADLYTAENWPGGLSLNQWALSAAAELRRQHAEIEHLSTRNAWLEEELKSQCNLHGKASEREAARMTQNQRMQERIAELEAQLSARQATQDGKWKCGNEYLPYHPKASHVDPSYRDGWNDCYRAVHGIVAPNETN